MSEKHAIRTCLPTTGFQNRDERKRTIKTITFVLTEYIVYCKYRRMGAAAINFVQDSGRAAALLHPLRLRILEALGEPDSAAGLARRLRMPRQKVNYHVRELARAKFLERAGRHRKRNMVEQRYVASAKAYVLAPELLGKLGPDAGRIEDRFSAAYLMALASQLQSELGRASVEATAQGKRLSTLSVSSELRLESPKQRAEFAVQLQRAVIEVVGRFASPAQLANGQVGPGRPYRLLLGCYPIPLGRVGGSGSSRAKG
jgi:DNA-binding transcriptional ArsR family regulator